MADSVSAHDEEIVVSHADVAAAIARAPTAAQAAAAPVVASAAAVASTEAGPAYDALTHASALGPSARAPVPAASPPAPPMPPAARPGASIEVLARVAAMLSGVVELDERMDDSDFAAAVHGAADAVRAARNGRAQGMVAMVASALVRSSASLEDLLAEACVLHAHAARAAPVSPAAVPAVQETRVTLHTGTGVTSTSFHPFGAPSSFANKTIAHKDLNKEVTSEVGASITRGAPASNVPVTTVVAGVAWAVAALTTMPIEAAAVHNVGHVNTLFTDEAAMQLLHDLGLGGFANTLAHDDSVVARAAFGRCIYGDFSQLHLICDALVPTAKPGLFPMAEAGGLKEAGVAQMIQRMETFSPHAPHPAHLVSAVVMLLHAMCAYGALLPGARRPAQGAVVPLTPWAANALLCVVAPVAAMSAVLPTDTAARAAAHLLGAASSAFRARAATALGNGVPLIDLALAVRDLNPLFLPALSVAGYNHLTSATAATRTVAPGAVASQHPRAPVTGKPAGGAGARSPQRVAGSPAAHSPGNESAPPTPPIRWVQRLFQAVERPVDKAICSSHWAGTCNRTPYMCRPHTPLGKYLKGPELTRARSFLASMAKDPAAQLAEGFTTAQLTSLLASCDA
jgi:hypothetical protein